MFDVLWSSHILTERHQILNMLHHILFWSILTWAVAADPKKALKCSVNSTKSSSFDISQEIKHWDISIFSHHFVKNSRSNPFQWCSFGFRSPFASNSVLLAALFNCGCLRQTVIHTQYQPVVACYKLIFNHLLKSYRTWMNDQLRLLQICPRIEGGVQLGFLTPARLRVVAGCLSLGANFHGQTINSSRNTEVSNTSEIISTSLHPFIVRWASSLRFLMHLCWLWIFQSH